MTLTRTEVSQLYVAVFGRASEGEGNSYWQTDRDNMVASADVMLATDAAKDYFGDSLDNNRAFIQHIYKNTLGKTSKEDPVGIAYWAEELDAGKTKGEVVAALITAAQDDINVGIAQDRFNNKVLVSDYAAEVLFEFTDIATFTDLIASVNETDASVVLAKAAVDALGMGEKFILTGETDSFDGTSGNDTFTAASGTLGGTDTLIDTNSNDRDVLNVSLAKNMDGVNEPVIQKIEAINVTYDHLSGAVTAFDATNVVGADITMLIGKAIDATATVVDAGINSVTAGTGVETLVVTNISNGAIDPGGAPSVIFDDAEADANRITITVNGDLDLGATTASSSRVTVNALADAVVDIDAVGTGSSSFVDKTTLFFGGDFNVTVKGAQLMDGLTTTDQTGKGDLIAYIDGGAAVDATGWSFDRIFLSSDQSGAGAATLSVKNSQPVFLDKTQTATTILENEDDTTAASINVSTGENHTLLVFGSTKGTASETVVNLNVTSDIILGTVTDSGTAGKLVLTGKNSVTIGVSDFAYVDASGLEGGFTFTAGAGAYVTGSATGENSIDASTFDLIYQGGAGEDTFDARSVETSTLITALGDGADTLLMDDTLVKATVAVDFGAGTDTLRLGNKTELSGADVGNLAAGTASTHSWSNLEKIELENLSSEDETVQVTVNGSDLSGKSIEFFTTDDGDTAELGIYTDSLSVDLSRLTFTNIDTVFIKGRGEDGTVIKGTGVGDIIDTGNANSAAEAIITTGGGDDTILIDHLGSGVSGKDLWDEDDMVSITDYAAAAVEEDNDTLDLSGELSVLGNITVADALYLADVTTEAETESDPLHGLVTNGIFTISGSEADVAHMDTLDEWVKAASLALDKADGTEADYDVVGFEFNANTYVMVHDDTGGASGDAVIDNVIKLAGLTGVDAVSMTAGAETIRIE
ncbi:MAG: hypothetical protein GY737_09565 [Desulfobacteraceae bacterium]|nr:hypothetical protein [Desulfobacteraceae bacterium]